MPVERLVDHTTSAGAYVDYGRLDALYDEITFSVVVDGREYELLEDLRDIMRGRADWCERPSDFMFYLEANGHEVVARDESGDVFGFDMMGQAGYTDRFYPSYTHVHYAGDTYHHHPDHEMDEDLEAAMTGRGLNDSERCDAYERLDGCLDLNCLSPA